MNVDVTKLVLIDENEYQQRIMDCINSNQIDTYFNLSKFKDKPECKQAIIYGMMIASMMTPSTKYYGMKLIEKESE